MCRKCFRLWLVVSLGREGQLQRVIVEDRLLLRFGLAGQRSRENSLGKATLEDVLGLIGRETSEGSRRLERQRGREKERVRETEERERTRPSVSLSLSLRCLPSRLVPAGSSFHAFGSWG